MSQVAKQCLECRRKRVDAICQNCGGTFQHKPSMPRAACSPSCAYALRGRASGDTQCRKIDLVCEWCGAIKKVSPAYADRKLCSRACAAAARSGPNNHSWKGGITTEHQSFFSSLIWRDKCREIWARDKGKCQRCDERPEQGHVHHIRSWSDYDVLRLDSGNLVLLCAPCHRWVHSKHNTAGDFLD